MFLFTEPYISEIAGDFIATADQNRIVGTAFVRDQYAADTYSFLPESQAANKLNAADGKWVYSNSENALDWIHDNLPDGHRVRGSIDLFKNKLKFRQEYSSVFGGLRYQSLTFEQLESYDFKDFGSSFIIKPTVGFLSAGVHRVSSPSEWKDVVKKIKDDAKASEGVFPKSVIDNSSYILEEIIEGREFAIDAFYDDNNEPVIVNIFEHIFRDQADMSDRLYVTSCGLIKEYLAPFTEFFQKLQEGRELSGFVLHVELRVGEDGEIKPIEVNPLRFAGWCTTDLAYFAYGINPYKCFAERRAVDWDAIFAKNDDRVYAMSVLSCDNIQSVNSFDYEAFSSRFSDLADLRRVDHTKFPLFGFAFFSVANREDPTLQWILESNLSEFIS